MTLDEFMELSAARALGVLPARDEQRFVAALTEHPDWLDAVDADRAAAVALAALAPEVVPPLALREQILAAAARTPQRETAASAPSESRVPGPIGAEGSGSDRRGFRWSILAAAAAVLLIAGVAVGTQLTASPREDSPAVLALQQIEAAADAAAASADVAGGGRATLHWSESRGDAVLVASDLPALAADRAFELWVVRGETPVSAGLMSVDEGQTVALLAEEVRPGDLVAVTVEPSGGSPSGAPTSEPILAIAAAAS